MRACRATGSASRSRRRSPSAPATTAPRAAASWRSTGSRSARRPRNILDVGTGTGVLAIAAARTLRRPVLASDIDGRAVRDRARECAAQSRGADITFVHAAGLGARRDSSARRRIDLVLANILLEPLQRLATPMARIVARTALRRAVWAPDRRRPMPRSPPTARRDSRSNGASTLGGWTTLVLRATLMRWYRVPSCSRQSSNRSTIRRPRRERAARQGAAHRARAARAHRLHRAARRPASERICAGLRGAARLAHRLYRLGRRRHRADGARGAVRRRPLHAAGARPGRHRRCSRSCIWSKRRPHEWLEKNLTADDRLGYDPWLHTTEGAEKLAKACAAAGATLIAVEPNPIDAIWTDRPAPPLGPVRAARHPLRRRGSGDQALPHPARDRRAQGRRAGRLRSARVAWTFNIRGSDVAHTPLPLAFAIVPREGRPALYVDGRKLSNDVRHRLEALADVREPADFDARPRRARQGQEDRAARPGDRRRRARAPDRQPGRQGHARRRSDRADEGGEELGRDRGRARGARARRRRGDALPRLARPRGAARKADRDRRRSRRWKASAARPACSRTSRSRPSRARAPTAPSCTTASRARPTGRSSRANCS